MKAWSSMLASALLLVATSAAAQSPYAQPSPMPMQGMQGMQGMNCGPTMGQQMSGMMSSGQMQAGITTGWILAALIGLATIFALVSLGIFLLRQSRIGAPSIEQPIERPRSPMREARAST